MHIFFSIPGLDLAKIHNFPKFNTKKWSITSPFQEFCIFLDLFFGYNEKGWRPHNSGNQPYFPDFVYYLLGWDPIPLRMRPSIFPQQELLYVKA